MKTTLPQALEAMDVLNRWVRMSGASRPRKAVYWLKTNYAIRDALMAGMMIKLRPVKATCKCNRCRDGVYFDWDGDNRGPCYHCNGTGLATLKFAEVTIDTTLPNSAAPSHQFVWHSPIDYRSWLGWKFDDEEYQEITDWKPGREGIDLDVETAAGLLNVVEEHWPQWIKEMPYSVCDDDDWDTCRSHYFRYSLEIEIPGESCVLCGRPKSHVSHSGRAPGLDLRFPCCNDPVCHNDPHFWDKLKSLPIPPIGPNLTAWCERHAKVFQPLPTWQAATRKITEPA